MGNQRDGVSPQVVPRDSRHAGGGGGCPRGEERHCSCKEGERQVITFLLEMEGVTALRGEKNPDMSMQLPVVLPENGREKRSC